jgi:hypothetical protein
VPGGQSHTLWQEVKTAPRLMTPANNTDLDLQVRFASPLGQRYQAQGILIEQDAANYLRFEFHHDGVSTRVFAAGFINNAPTVYRNLPVSVRDESYLWVGRLGDVWTLAFSDDGSAWTVLTSFAQPLRVTAAGVFAGNDAAPGEIPPAHAAVIDYFLNTADALDLEDGVRNTLTIDDRRPGGGHGRSAGRRLCLRARGAVNGRSRSRLDLCHLERRRQRRR